MVDENIQSKIEIFLSAKKLIKADLLSGSDPFLVLYLKNQALKENNKVEVGRTETINNSQNVTWKKRFVVNYNFEELQELEFDIFDRDSKSEDLNEHDFLGCTSMSLGELVAAPGQTVHRPLQGKKGKKKKRGILTIRCEEIQECNENAVLSISGKGLPKMDTFGKIDAYLQIHRQREDNSWVQIKQTETKMKNYNPTWDKFVLPIQTLCNGDFLRPLKIKVFDWDKNSQDDYVGEFETNLRSILDTLKKGHSCIFQLEDKESKKKKKKSRGSIQFNSVKTWRKHSFLDYIKGGCQIGLLVAIDFTGSNGDPRDPRSLHYLQPGVENSYEKVISQVGEILAPYDSDGMIPLYGFGGKIPGENRANHCFPVTFNHNQVEVPGVDGLLGAYRNCLKQIKLSGPTYFSPLLQEASIPSQQPYAPGLQHYSILLIITDGIINDMDKTIQAVIGASNYPMSIIIVGVGDANFDAMERLDADDEVLTHGNMVAKRDIVQFVPMNQFKGKHISELSKCVLAEVPGQLSEYMKTHNVDPMEPLQAPEYVDTYDPQPTFGAPPPMGGIGPPQQIAPPSFGAPPSC